MARWTGVWIGVWDGGEASEPGVLNAALNVAGTGASTFGAELTEAPVQGGVRKLIYSSLLNPQLPSTVSASLVVAGKGDARFAPALGQAVQAGMVVAGGAGAQFGARVAVGAALAVSAQSSTTLAAAATVQAGMQAAGAGAASFGATSDTRTVVVPLRPRVELAEDEMAAILLLLAA